jgi:hypothetical protein
MTISIAYEQNGYWGKEVINYFLKKIYPDEIIEWTKDVNKSKVIVYSVWGRAKPQKNKKYIGFSGESFCPSINPACIKTLYILSHIENSNIDNIHIPYFLSSPHLYKEPIDNKTERQYFLAYCNTNVIHMRESLFAHIAGIKGHEVCHSLGPCNGGLEKTSRKIGGTWKSDELINAYTQYKFVIAMENKQVEGYVTEKILNVFYSGAIPIYWGAPDINNYFNPNAFINVSDFRSIEDCAEYIINMSTEKREKMTQEPIYANTDIAFLMYDKDTQNSLRDRYTKKIKDFLQDTIEKKSKDLHKEKSNLKKKKRK